MYLKKLSIVGTFHLYLQCSLFSIINDSLFIVVFFNCPQLFQSSFLFMIQFYQITFLLGLILVIIVLYYLTLKKCISFSIFYLNCLFIISPILIILSFYQSFIFVHYILLFLFFHLSFIFTPRNTFVSNFHFPISIILFPLKVC